MNGVDEREREDGRQRMERGWDMVESKFHTLHGYLVVKRWNAQWRRQERLITPQPFHFQNHVPIAQAGLECENFFVLIFSEESSETI